MNSDNTLEQATRAPLGANGPYIGYDNNRPSVPTDVYKTQRHEARIVGSRFKHIINAQKATNGLTIPQNTTPRRVDQTRTVHTTQRNTTQQNGRAPALTLKESDCTERMHLQKRNLGFGDLGVTFTITTDITGNGSTRNSLRLQRTFLMEDRRN